MFSNICTNQGLMAVAATMYMSLLGADGLRKVATTCYLNALHLKEQLTQINGVEAVFDSPMFHEFVLKLNHPVAKVLEALAESGIQGGYNLTDDYPELGECLLVCATETKTEEDMQDYAKALQQVEERL